MCGGIARGRPAKRRERGEAWKASNPEPARRCLRRRRRTRICGSEGVAPGITEEQRCQTKGANGRWAGYGR
eukprot:4960756-Alexandrium_andersonii.AAC.1